MGLHSSDNFTMLNTTTWSGQPALAVSVLFNEEPAWFNEWITLTHAALALVDHCIIISVSPAKIDECKRNLVILASRNVTGCVLFSPPSVKTKFGLDLLLGHVANIRHAHRHFPRFTHAVLAASNNMWIVKLTSSWPGFSSVIPQVPPYNGDCSGPRTHCRPAAIAKTARKWHWEKLIHDSIFWDFVDNKKLDVCNTQHEGFLATKQAWMSAVSMLEPVLRHNIDVPPNLMYDDVGYPAEEIYLATVFCGLQSSFQITSKNFWLPWNMWINRTDVMKARADGFLMVKRVPRTPGDPIIGYCRESQF